MFVWIGGHPLLTQDVLIGQVNIKMDGFKIVMPKMTKKASLGSSQKAPPTTFKLEREGLPICQANKKIGEANIELRYQVK